MRTSMGYEWKRCESRRNKKGEPIMYYRHKGMTHSLFDVGKLIHLCLCCLSAGTHRTARKLLILQIGALARQNGVTAVLVSMSSCSRVGDTSSHPLTSHIITLFALTTPFLSTHWPQIFRRKWFRSSHPSRHSHSPRSTPFSLHVFPSTHSASSKSPISLTKQKGRPALILTNMVMSTQL